MIPVEIKPVALPQSLDVPGARDFRDYAEIVGVVTNEQTGGGAALDTAVELLAELWDEHDALRTALLARSGTRAVGAAHIAAPRGGLHADIAVYVPRRSAGLEGLLIAAAEDQARRYGRVRVRAVTLHRSDLGGDAIVAVGGEGAVPRDPQARAHAEAGYALRGVLHHDAGDGLADTGGTDYLTAAWLRTLTV
jgi:GNAT superfamily N-acetyltransferase